MNPLNQLKNAAALSFVVLGLVCFGLSPAAQAIEVSPTPLPTPDGGYPGNNTAEGTHALFDLTTGTNNTATGYSALDRNTTGGNNTANGAYALFSDITGNDNTAIGNDALKNNTVTGNTAIGRNALINDSTGQYNTVVGASAETSTTTGAGNTVLGQGAGGSIATGGGNVIIGYGQHNALGPAESNHTYIRNIETTVVTSGYYVGVTPLGLLGHTSSSRRYKEDIKPMDKASEAVFALKPVAYRYKKEIDPVQPPAYGLVAEEVAEVNPHLVSRNSPGQSESVHYDMVNAMLLNEFLKEHKAFLEQQDKIKELEATVGSLATTVKEQAAQIQKVSDELASASASHGGLEMSKATANVVLNNP